MIDSKFLELSNRFFAFVQSKLQKFTDESLILSKIDDIIFFFMSLTLIVSTFMQSEQIGLFAMIVIGLSFAKMFIKRGSKLALTKWDVAILVYFVICFVSTINSTLLAQSIHGFLKTVIYVLYYFCAANYFQNNKNPIKYVFILVCALCAIESVIAIFQNIAGVEQISTWQDKNYINPEDAIARAYGTLKPLNPNLLGGYLIAGMPYVIGTCATGLVLKNKKLFLSSFAVFLTCSMAIFVTGCRGAYLALAAMIAAMILISGLIIKTDFSQDNKLKSLYKKAVTAMISGFALVLVFIPKITKRLLSIFILRGDSSTSFRMNVYHSSWQMFCDNWILGIGAGNQTFREIYGLYMITGFDALSTYSVPLEIAVESGIFGLLSFAAFLILLLIGSIKFLMCNCLNRLPDKAIVSAGILLIVGVMVHGMFDTIYFRPQVQFLFWTMIAMVSALLMQQKKTVKVAREVKNG